jgi:ABC-type nitrate/sulfonate/bicarbonate transport system substrate-binding protein
MLFAGLALLSCQKQYRGPQQSIVLGLQVLEPVVPIVVAEERHFFSESGITVTVKSYDTGLGAMNALLQGEVDVAGNVSDYVFATKALEGRPVKILASFDRDDYVFILGRKDHGIQDIADLRGARIGVLRGTAQEFYLGRFLQLHGMSTKDVRLVSVPTLSDSVDRIVSGDIDAIVSVDPYLNDAQVKLGENAIEWPAQSSQPFYALLVAKTDWISSHGEAVERFLSALGKAEDFILQNPDGAKKIAEMKMGFSQQFTERIWSRNVYSLSLEQSLVTALQDEARWLIAEGLTEAKQVPNFRASMYVEGLKAVQPNTVNVIE